MKPYGVSDRLKSSEVCDCRRTPIRKGLCTCKNKHRKTKLSASDKQAYKSFKTSTRQAGKKACKVEEF